ncbi:MAG: type 2 isopentenyl-diphosphate Delta-isomerase [Balneolaceae bacterium]
MSIKNRKKDHVDLCINDDVTHQTTTGFEQYRFDHNALPELDVDDIDIEGSLLGRAFSFPLMISSMTGGYAGAESINRMIAEFCEEENLPFGVGSQRALFDDPDQAGTFSVVREAAPTAFIAANIGGAQLIGGLPAEQLELLISSIRADAIIVHLNPLQELIQPEGDRQFAGIEDGIRKLVVDAPVPVIVKETGAGINGEVARRLLAAGVEVVDVSGAGGTSWSKVENLRTENPDLYAAFNDWGNPTARCVEEVAALREAFRFELIASGGIASPFDMVKALCLGADMVGAARPVLLALDRGGIPELKQMVGLWKRQARMICTLIGCRALRLCSPSYLIKE